MRAGRPRGKAVGGVGVGWLMMLGVLVCAMTFPASPARASLTCLVSKHAAEVAAGAMPLEPANGATLPAGTPVTFSGETGNVLTFSVASSEALLSSADIDSGAGSQSGASYRFISTKATTSPRTIYWTASFTFTPEGCESPSTFTTPVRTLVVVPSQAELAIVTKQQEEAAAKKKSEEEATAKKKEEEIAAAGSVVLDGATIEVDSSHEATVKLTCSDVARCAGKLTLAARVAAGKGKMRHLKTQSIGTASFSIAAGKASTVRVKLNTAGRALINAAHGHLNANLMIARTTPLPNKTQTQRVRLEQSKMAKVKRRK